jgi:hypothetical protein
MTQPISGNTAVASAVEVVRRFVAECHPLAEAALLAGSQARGLATVGSDYDVVLLFPSVAAAWREMMLFEGRHIEVFAHDLGTLAYFCRELDRPSGRPALPTMIVEGISVLSESSAVLEAARQIAADTLRQGPPVLDGAALRARRYAITDLATALRANSARSVRLATGSALLGELADFALRAEGRWSASGKALSCALAIAVPQFAERLETAFTALFAQGDVTLVQALVDDVLEPHGGRLREGYRQVAPVDWSDNPARLGNG